MKTLAMLSVAFLVSACDQGPDAGLSQSCSCLAEIESAMESALDTATVQDQTVKSEVERQLFNRTAELESVIISLRARIEVLETASP